MCKIFIALNLSFWIIKNEPFQQLLQMLRSEIIFVHCTKLLSIIFLKYDEIHAKIKQDLKSHDRFLLHWMHDLILKKSLIWKFWYIEWMLHFNIMNISLNLHLFKLSILIIIWCKSCLRFWIHTILKTSFLMLLLIMQATMTF